MATLYLRCVDKHLSGAEWLLELRRDGGRLSADGAPKATFTLADAEKRFVFPSFWQSIKNLGIVADDGQTIWFVPDRELVEDLRHYLGGALAAQGSAAVSAVRTKGWFQILGGAVIMLVAIVGTIATMVEAFGKPTGGRYVIAIGVLAVGGALTARGMTALGRANRATRGFEPADSD